MQKLTNDDLLGCASLAALRPKEGEARAMLEDMEQLLLFAKRLDGLDGLDGPNAGQALNAQGALCPRLRRRDDIAMPSLTQAEALANAPEHSGGFFVVPKIL